MRGCMSEVQVDPVAVRKFRERVLITERKKLQAVQRKLAEGRLVLPGDVERIASRLCILLTQEYKV